MELSVKRGRAGWQEHETTRLFTAVKEATAAGTPLRAVFETLSKDLGRKPNSIRNYYYSQLHAQPDTALQRSAPFILFTQEETHELLRQVLMARGRGASVRSCVMQMAGGDRTRMLRYQNKYRTLLRTRPDLISAVRTELQQEGLPCPGEEPRLRHEQADPAFLDPDDAAASRLMAKPCVASLLEGLKELLQMAARAEEATDQQQQLDRMQVRHDLMRIAWQKEYDAAVAKASSLASTLRSFLALPVEEQAAQLATFRAEAASALAAFDAPDAQPALITGA